ncbi:MAG: hypothetical protein AB2L26_05945 [Ignavibacteria bacterium]
MRVERGINGVWTKVGFVQGKGNSNQNVTYKFTDKKVVNGQVFIQNKTD